MNETTRTLTFVGAAALLAAAAFGMHLATQPVSLADFNDVGEQFYPDFNDPREATSLRVAAYDKDAARVDVFNVAKKDGLWRIPSHHDYPADGEDQLAKTATSIIGLERGALASTSADDHKRLGVLDPLDEEVTGTEGRGDRITLTKGEDVLVDYIIGNQIEDGPQNTYYVRRKDENRTYRVTLDVDVSTKFADWIEPDLLDFRRGDIRELVVDRYSVDESRGVIVPGEVSTLTRSTQDDPWTLAGLDEKAQKVKVSTVNSAITALEQMAIVGVRKKPAGLSADLKQGSIIAEDGSVSMSAIRSLQDRGFFLLPDGSLKSNEGEVTLALANGVKYVLGFGEVFTGSEAEIEIGNQGGGEDPAAEDDEPADDGQETTDADGDKAPNPDADETDEDADEDSSVKKSRYLFILTQFDESTIEPLPDKPIKPEPPTEAKEEAETEAKPADAQPDDAADKPAADDAADEPKSGEEADDEQPEEESPAEEAPAEEAEADETPDADQPDADKPEAEEAPKADKPDADAAYKDALAKYENDLKAWEAKKTAREEKIEAGEKRVAELNERFADWYYVISAKTFDEIRVAPDALVEPADPPKEDEEKDAAAAPPALPKPESPAVEPKAKETPEPKPEPEDAKPAADAKPATEEKPSEEAKPAEEDKPEQPAEEKPAEEPPAEPAPEANDEASS